MTYYDEKHFVTPGYGDSLSNQDFYHHIPATTNRRHVRLDNNDHMILKAVSANKRKPMATVLHCMIGQSVKCWEERHELAINALLDEVIALRHIVRLYRERYGRLPVVKRDNKE